MEWEIEFTPGVEAWWSALTDREQERIGILLVGGEKTGDDRWYERMVPVADRLYQAHLTTLIRKP